MFVEKTKITKEKVCLACNKKLATIDFNGRCETCKICINNGVKFCSECNDVKDLSLFPNKNGSKCKECNKKIRFKPKTRECITCELEFNIDFFRSENGGLNLNCKDCVENSKKRCTYCNKIKRIDDFYATNGCQCKECAIGGAQKKCRTCDKEYEPDFFRIDNGKAGKNCINCFNNDCKKCMHCEKIKSYNEYYTNDRYMCILCEAIYIEDNREKISKRANERNKIRREIDPIYNCRVIVSSLIFKRLKANDSSKNGISCWSKLPYDPSTLKQHIEDQFSSPENLDYNGNVWMTWENWGKYNSKTWNENDSSTWVWNIDHIMPQTKLPYNNMDHPNFIKCWDLSNLRPYSAKKNIKDGNRRI